MQVSVEELEPCKVRLTIEVEPEKTTEAEKKVYKKYSRELNIPGFRKGKAPRSVIEHYVSEQSIKERIMDHVVTLAYVDALNETKIDAYPGPEVNIEKFEVGQPFKFTIDVPLHPKIELGGYKGIEVEHQIRKVEEKDIEAQIKRIQHERTTSEKVEGRGAQEGDFVIAEITSTVEGEEKAQPKRSVIHVGNNIPAFDEQITGLKPEESKSFTIEYPKDFSQEELAGKKVQFDISIESIREPKIPELNDEFAQSLGEFQNMDDIRSAISKRLEIAAEDNAERETESKIVEEVISRSAVHFPDNMLRHEIEHDIENLRHELEGKNLTLEQYLEHMGKTEEEFRKVVEEAAEKRIRTGLVLGKIAEAEGINVTDEEIENEIDLISESLEMPRKATETYLEESAAGRDKIRNRLLTTKILDFLKSVSVIKSGEVSAEST